MLKTGTRLSIFPLPGALLLPRAYLPLHIFEPRYRAMVNDSLARDRRIAMIQPLPVQIVEGEAPPLFEVGCVGKIAQVEAFDDGRYNVTLEGLSRFRVVRELETNTLFRQIEASFDEFDDLADDDSALPSVVRAGVEHEARRFAAMRGLRIDWESVERLHDEALVNGLTQSIPFDVAIKQALLEALTIDERAGLLMEFLRLGAAGDDQTLQ